MTAPQHPQYEVVACFGLVPTCAVTGVSRSAGGSSSCRLRSGTFQGRPTAQVSEPVAARDRAASVDT
jgi:hypothetical protein